MTRDLLRVRRGRCGRAIRWSSSTTSPSAATSRTSRRRRILRRPISRARSDARRAAIRDAGQCRYQPGAIRPGERQIAKHRGDHRPEAGARAVRRRARHPPGRSRPICQRRHGARDPDRSRHAPCQFHPAGGRARAARGRPDGADHGRCLSRSAASRRKLTTIEPQINTDTRTIKLQATLANPDHLLLPGMFAHVRVVLPDQPDVVTRAGDRGRLHALWRFRVPHRQGPTSGGKPSCSTSSAASSRPASASTTRSRC